MAKVLNKYKDELPPDAVYIGRGSPWGNPFPITPDRDRTRAIEEYKGYLMKNLWLVHKAIRELKGKDLICFCAPLPCHGDVLLEIVNDEDRTEESR